MSKNKIRDYLRRAEAYSADLSALLKLDDESLSWIFYSPGGLVISSRTEVFYTSRKVEVYAGGKRFATHARLYLHVRAYRCQTSKEVTTFDGKKCRGMTQLTSSNSANSSVPQRSGLYNMYYRVASTNHSPITPAKAFCDWV